MRAIIFAMSPEGVIGVGGTIPWHYPADMKRFKRLTLGSTVVMGRKTFESIGKALPGRRNIVVTSHALEVPGVESVPNLPAALARAGDGDVWFVGGARIYAEAMAHVDRIDVTYVPDRVTAAGAVLAPRIDESVFEPGPLQTHEGDSRLKTRVYSRRIR